MISELYDVPFADVNEHPLMVQINKLSLEYLDKKIVDTYGDEYYMGSSTGGFTYDMYCNQLVKETEDGEEEYIDLE